MASRFLPGLKISLNVSAVKNLGFSNVCGGMMKWERFALCALVLFFLPVYAHAQLWNGVLSSSRGTDWASAGVRGGIPSGTWAQCNTDYCNKVTAAGPAATAAQIIAALNSALPNTYVLLQPGRYNLTAAIVIKGKDNVALRGSGANSTFLVFANGIQAPCEQGAGYCLLGFDTADGSYWGGPTGLTNWTGGYTQGTNTITLASTKGIVNNSTLIILDQDDDGYTGPGVPFTKTGPVDTGSFFVCADEYKPADPRNGNRPTGCAQPGQGPDTGFARVHRFTQEVVEATAVNSGTGVVTITPNLIYPNWRAGQSPQAWQVQPSRYVGFENFSVDAAGSTLGTAIGFGGVAHGWVSGVRIVNARQSAISTWMCSRFTIQNNYIYNTGQNYSFTDNWAIRLQVSTLGLVQNNILQKNTVGVMEEGPGVGHVIAYNFIIDNYNYSDALGNALRPHSAGDDYQLYEGNIASDIYLDKDHGTHLMETAYRNFLTGYESCGGPIPICGQASIYGGTFPTGTHGHKDSGVIAINSYQFNRYINAVANVLGTPGVTHTYRLPNGGNYGIYSLGFPYDNALVVKTSYFWGNWDAKTGATRWCGSVLNTGWAQICGGISEVPTNFIYGQPLPTLGDVAAGMGPLPASLYLRSKPSWFGSLPWPPIGPDVTAGNVGQCGGVRDTVGTYALLPATSSNQCTGTSFTAAAWGGHVNANPAMNCFLNVMGGKPDGTNGALAFDADTCYGKSGAGQTLPPTGLKAIVK
jgi:hypothetical protein